MKYVFASAIVLTAAGLAMLAIGVRIHSLRLFSLGRLTFVVAIGASCAPVVVAFAVNRIARAKEVWRRAVGREVD
jgi:hypothetical protein